MGAQIGKELVDYILQYGYLAFEYSELYGINSRQFLESDMVKLDEIIQMNFEYGDIVNG